MGVLQDLSVVDNICGDLDFEDGGKPVVMNRVLAACDPVLVDAYVCQMMHYQVEDVPYVKLAGELGAGCSDISKAEILFCQEEAEKILPKSSSFLDAAIAAMTRRSYKSDAVTSPCSALRGRRTYLLRIESRSLPASKSNMKIPLSRLPAYYTTQEQLSARNC